MYRTRSHTRRRRPLIWLALALLLIALSRTAVSTAAPPAQPTVSTRLAIQGDRFSLNGTPTFLLGVSYFDARFWRESDLDALAQRGYTLIRIWLDWEDQSFFDGRGQLTATGRTQLLGLVDAADRRGMVVDVTILDTELPFTHADAPTAVGQVGRALADRGNVLYDLVNEFNHSAGPFTLAELGRLAAALRAADPDALFGVSSTGGYLVRDPAALQAANLQKLVAAPLAAPLVIPHMSRTADWAVQTGPRVQALRAGLRGLSPARPVYLQEEARRGHSGLNPSRAEFLSAAQAARTAGAAAWVFHTDAGFALDQQSFMAALDAVERAVLDDLPAALGQAPPRPTPAPTATPAPPRPTSAPTATPTPPPPAGAPFAVGVRIEAEDARSAGERSRNGNAGSAPDYPNLTGLDINRCYACTNQHSARMTWGEWAGYPVAVPTTGRYTIRLRAVTITPDRTLTVRVDGVPVSTGLRVPPGATYSDLREVATAPIPLTAGTHDIVLLAPQGMIVDWLQVDPAP